MPNIVEMQVIYPNLLLLEQGILHFNRALRVILCNRVKEYYGENGDWWENGVFQKLETYKGKRIPHATDGLVYGDPESLDPHKVLRLFLCYSSYDSPFEDWQPLYKSAMGIKSTRNYIAHPSSKDYKLSEAKTCFENMMHILSAVDANCVSESSLQTLYDLLKKGNKWYIGKDSIYSSDESSIELGSLDYLSTLYSTSTECASFYDPNSRIGRTNTFEFQVMDNGICLRGCLSHEEFLNVPKYISINGVNHLVSVLGSELFDNNDTLRNIVLPDTLDEIGAGCFKKCSSLTEINLGPNIHKILPYTFKGCVSLKKVNANGTIGEIGTGAFKDCTSLSEIPLMFELENIGSHAFEGCKSLTEFAISGLVGKLSAGLFKNSGLKKVIWVDSANYEIGTDSTFPPDVVHEYYDDY